MNKLQHDSIKIKVLYQFLKIFVIDKLDFLNHVLKPILIG